MADLDDVPLSQRVAAVETGMGRRRGVKRQREGDDASFSKRKDHNAPTEVSSKRRASSRPEKVARSAPKARGECLRKLLLPEQLSRACGFITDPRFDSAAGTYSEEHFRAAYGFLDDMRVCTERVHSTTQLSSKPCLFPGRGIQAAGQEKS